MEDMYNVSFKKRKIFALNLIIILSIVIKKKNSKTGMRTEEPSTEEGKI